ncbi:MAG: ATP-dependent helicase [Deltaproteobacteria bacterium]
MTLVITQAPTPDQRRVITSHSPWISVQAQPGSGKTRVLVERVIHLLEGGQGKGEVVAITFTEKAAEEIKKRVEKSLNRSGSFAIPGLWVSTIHGFCLRILKEYSWLVGLSHSFSILSEEEQIFFLEIAMRNTFMELEARGSKPYFNLCSFYELGQCEAMIRQLFKFRFQLESIPLPIDSISLQIYNDLKFVFGRVLSGYEALKKEHRASDFDDLLFSALCLLRKENEVRKELRRRFSAILVDEFQDTDEIQKEILDLLTKEDEDRFPPPSLMIVGDLNQSIYRFRGANVDLFRNLKEDIVLKGGSSFELVQNFRSSEPVIEFVNALFEPLLGRDFLKSLPPERHSERDSAKSLKTGVEYWTATGGRPREATWLATYINSFRKDGGGEMWSHIAILLRGMTYSHLYEKALSEAGIPWVKSQESRFYEKPEISWLLAPLKWVCDPTDDYSRWLALSSPLGKRSFDSLERLKGLKGLVSLTEWYASFVTKMTPVTIRFLETVLQFEKKYSKADWKDFLIYMEVLKRAAVKSSTEEFQGDGVRIMTVHQAKGLEFEVVFLPDLGYLPKGESPWLLASKKMGIGLKIPSEKPFDWKGDVVYQEIQEAEKEAHIAESKRIFYVAATRAKRWLVLSHSSPKPRKESWAYWMEENRGCLKPYMKEGEFE